MLIDSWFGLIFEAFGLSHRCTMLEILQNCCLKVKNTHKNLNLRTNNQFHNFLLGVLFED